VLNAVRAEVGTEFVVGLRATDDEFKTGGLTVGECVEIATIFELGGHVEFSNILAGAPYDDLGSTEWVLTSGVIVRASTRLQDV